eukprot:gnl/MRDRNA2_/MRDRNA2_74341_c0_seq1.p1 gnl/MRDRNA2_/MRDRNA2_74341_c0~~gnl/MRDRNA2_/MRDRNA2_74341_c0_seq1.p1  ORF type:complete len:320 (+),score=52.25 gnl/MRDRNA2_/MRDRNA2_74341_c0_seq1:710-1669(+)
MKFFDGKEYPGIKPDAMMMLPITLITQLAGNPLGAFLNQEWSENVNHVSMLGVWTMAASVFCASYMTRLLPFALFYGSLVGIGIGTAYSAPLVAGWTWFPNDKGLVTGVTLAGFGSAAFIFNQVGTRLINPDNLPPEQADKYVQNFAPALRKLSVIYAVLGGVGCALIQKSPAALAAPAAAVANVEEETMAAVKSVEFVLLWICLVLLSIGGLNVINFHKIFGIEAALPVSDKFFSMLGAYGALFNGVGRIFWGSTVDTFGFKGPWLIMSSMMALLLILYMRSAQSKMAYSITTCLIFFAKVVALQWHRRYLQKFGGLS